jgi:hypothetical protein
MKRLILGLCVLTSACATRHAADTSTWFADCYQKKALEENLAAELVVLNQNNFQGRRSNRLKYWNLQQKCQ